MLVEVFLVYGKINSFVAPFVLITHYAIAVRSSLLGVSGVCVLSVV